ncbi:hypothetical protein DCC81_19195 [Chitinophaga parva]|uniref:DUF4272 domain-containing protein n=1 Tax=Chitinophaga parva TaxID=2169414 RepID=A0A2T7BJ96_9BACT|nr:DUF4272 domain-containing protein [Chitinophaga parva]PUZ26348.1 hypothetical protein DCC81_19195 [Chitinophaga parva]
METYTLYFHRPDYEGLLAKAREAFPQARIRNQVQDGSQKIEITTTSGFLGRRRFLDISYRQREQPGYQLQRATCPVTAQLMGMYNFVAGIEAQDSAVKERLLRKIQTINAEVAISLGPDLSAAFQEFLQQLARDYDAVLFANVKTSLNKTGVPQFQDSRFRNIMDAEGSTGDGEINIQIDSKYFDGQKPATDAQLARKAATEALLREKGIRVNTHLPCVPDAGETNLRAQETIIERAYALLVTAALGAGVPKERLDGTRKEFDVKELSPEEDRYYQMAQLDAKAVSLCAWRYESLNVLLWALGLVKDLAYPEQICDVDGIIALMLRQPRTMMTFQSRPRSVDEILDALDQTYRMHWACVQARLEQQAPGGNLNADVVYERHYALNWLVRYQEQDWDEVTTNT